MEADSAVVDRYKPRGLARVLRAAGASLRDWPARSARRRRFARNSRSRRSSYPWGLWLGHSGIERALLVGPVLLVLIAELLNSAIEATVDRIGFERHALAGLAKDIGSAAGAHVVRAAHRRVAAGAAR